MSRTRASALLASFAVMLSTMVGFTLTSTAASATPAVHYPPPPPSLVVNHGVVKTGVTVRATGRKFKARERVIITIRFQPKGSNRYRTVRTTSAWADRFGRFTTSVRTSSAGTVVIIATGRFSRQTATASVSVINKRKWGRSWAMKPAAFTGGPGASGTASTSAAPAGDVSGLAIAGLALVAMTGGAVVTQRTVRRRREAGMAA